MSKVKSEAIELISNLPDECSLADIMAQLYFKAKVESGLRDIEAGRIITHDELRKRVSMWIGSIGR